MSAETTVFNKDIPIWPKDVTQALKIQNQLRHEVILKNQYGKLNVVAGVDCSFDVKGNTSFAFIVLMESNTRKIIATARADLPTEFPYIPGFLSFREIPVILKALEELPQMPDFFMVDGQGTTHPRRLGIAAHLGVLTGIPAIGVAKSRLCGTYKEPENTRGAIQPLWDKEEMIGFVLRSKQNVKPLFISAGHCFSHETATDLVIKHLGKYRLPEPTRLADKISKQKANMPILI